LLHDKVLLHLVNQTGGNDSDNYTYDGFMSPQNPLAAPMLVKIQRPISIWKQFCGHLRESLGETGRNWKP
jgi:hypothetical protein